MTIYIYILYKWDRIEHAWEENIKSPVPSCLRPESVEGFGLVFRQLVALGLFLLNIWRQGEKLKNQTCKQTNNKQTKKEEKKGKKGKHCYIAWIFQLLPSRKAAINNHDFSAWHVSDQVGCQKIFRYPGIPRKVSVQHPALPLMAPPLTHSVLDICVSLP